MKVWLRQRHSKLVDSFRYGEASFGADRVVVICPDTENVLIDCSKAFFESEVAKGRIITKKPS